MSLNNNPLWRIVSSGYAGENLELGSKNLEVFLPEVSGFTEGEINSTPTVLTTNGVDNRGNNYTCQITTTNTIDALWRQQGSNRITPPDIRRGERVDIWQYEFLDEYRWSATGEDEKLRRLETATWAFSNTQDESVEQIDETNSYNVQVSTHQKQINVNTTDSDGEPFTHHIQIDTKNGNFHYRDSAGNYIQVEADGSVITLENSVGSFAKLAGENVTLNAVNELNLNCRKLNITADTINETASTKQVTADVATSGGLTNNGKNVGSSHNHGNVENGGGSTSGPN